MISLLHHKSLLFIVMLSFVLGILVALWPDGISVGGVRLDTDSVTGNMNFYKSIEGFMESMPQSIYQSSIMMRSKEISMNKF